MAIVRDRSRNDTDVFGAQGYIFGVRLRENLRLRGRRILTFDSDRIFAVKVSQKLSKRTKILATVRAGIHIIGNRGTAAFAFHYKFLFKRLREIIGSRVGGGKEKLPLNSECGLRNSESNLSLRKEAIRISNRPEIDDLPLFPVPRTSPILLFDSYSALLISNSASP
jgi:hypothetical protein